MSSGKEKRPRGKAKCRTNISAAFGTVFFLFVLTQFSAAQPKNDPDKKGFALDEFAKPFAVISFDHVRAQSREHQEANFASVSQNRAQMNAGAFSFSHYLAPPSSSFGALMEGIRAELLARDVQRTYAAESSQFDHLLEVTRYLPIQFGMGSVRRDALDDYDDRLLERPVFVKPNP